MAVEGHFVQCCRQMATVGIANRVTYHGLILNYRTQCRKAKIIARSIVDREHTPRLCPAVLLRQLTQIKNAAHKVLVKTRYFYVTWNVLDSCDGSCHAQLAESTNVKIALRNVENICSLRHNNMQTVSSFTAWMVQSYQVIERQGPMSDGK